MIGAVIPSVTPATMPNATVRSAPVTCLIVPGLGGSGPDHWQSRWEDERADCVRVDLSHWDAPSRSKWVANLDAAILATPARKVLVGHSLGCHAIAWWAAQAGDRAAERVSAALLVAPPDVLQQGADHRLLRFAPAPPGPLPFRSVLVASRNDPYATLARSHDLARTWGADFIDAGTLGHINAVSDLADWTDGQAILDGLIHTCRR